MPAFLIRRNSRSITICKPKHQKDRYCCRSSPIYIKSPNRALTVFYIFDTGFSALRLRHLIMANLVLYLNQYKHGIAGER